MGSGKKFMKETGTRAILCLGTLNQVWCVDGVGKSLHHFWGLWLWAAVRLLSWLGGERKKLIQVGPRIQEAAMEKEN